MRKNKLFLVVAALGLSAVAMADAGKHLSVIPADNPDTPVHFTLDGIHKITFDADNNMTINHSEGNQTIPLKNIKSIRFDMEVSAKEEINTTLTDDLNMKMSGGILTLAYKSEKKLNVAVFDIKGRQIFSGVSNEAISVDFNAYPAGVYIVKANDKILKIKN